jgi:hypothetical protein
MCLPLEALDGDLLDVTHDVGQARLQRAGRWDISRRCREFNSNAIAVTSFRTWRCGGDGEREPCQPSLRSRRARRVCAR